MRKGLAASVGMVLAAALIGLGLQGGDDVGGTPGAGTHAPHARHASGTARSPAPRPYIGKPQPPVRVRLAQQPALEVGVPADLWLEVRTAVPVSNLELIAEGNDGLAVIDVQRFGPVSAVRGRDGGLLDEASVSRYRIGAVPTGAPAGSVSGQVRFTVRGIEQAAPFRIQLSAGGGGPSVLPSTTPSVPVMTDAAGEQLAVMPAETDTREGPAH